MDVSTFCDISDRAIDSANEDLRHINLDVRVCMLYQDALSHHLAKFRTSRSAPQYLLTEGRSEVSVTLDLRS